MKILRLSLLVVLVSLMCSSPAFAGTYYVSTTGDNANDGTSPATAWKTISYASANAPDTSTILVSDGTYYENIYHTNDRASNLTFKSINHLGAKVVGDSTGVFRFGTHNSRGSLVNLTVDGFLIENTYQGTNYDSGGGIATSYGSYADKITVQNCNISTGWGSAIVFGLNSGKNFIVRNNDVYSGASRAIKVHSYFSGLEYRIVENNNVWGSTKWVYGTGGGGISGVGTGGYIANNTLWQAGYSGITASGAHHYNNTFMPDGYAHNAQEIGASNGYYDGTKILGSNWSWQTGNPHTTQAGNCFYGAGTALVKNVTIINSYTEDTEWTNMYAGGHMHNVMYKNHTMIRHDGTATYVQGYFYDDYGGSSSTSDKNIFIDVYADVEKAQYPITITNLGTNLDDKTDLSLDTRDTITFMNYYLTGDRASELYVWFLTYVSNSDFTMTNRWKGDIYAINHNEVEIEDVWIHMPNRNFDGTLQSLYWIDINVTDGDGNPMSDAPVVPVSNQVNPVTGDPIYAMNANCTTAAKGVVDFINDSNPVVTKSNGHTPTPDEDIVNTVALTRQIIWRNEAGSKVATPVSWNITAFGFDNKTSGIYTDPVGFTDTQVIYPNGTVTHRFGFKSGTTTGVTVNKTDFRMIDDLSNITKTVNIALDTDISRSLTTWEITPTTDIATVYGVDSSKVTAKGQSFYVNKSGGVASAQYNLFIDGAASASVTSDSNGKISYLYDEAENYHEFEYVRSVMIFSPGMINRVNKYGFYSYPLGVNFNNKIESKLMGYCS